MEKTSNRYRSPLKKLLLLSFYSKNGYQISKNLYIDTFETQYAEYLEALGIDGEQDYSNQPCLMYEDITWGEYFEGRALQLIQEIYIFKKNY